MTDNNAVQELKLVSVTTGFDKTASDLDKADAAARRASISADQLSVSQTKLGRSSIDVSSSLDRQTRMFDPLSRAMSQLSKFETDLGRARAQGISISDATARAHASITDKVKELSKGLNDNTQAHTLNRMQMMESMHVAKSLFDEIAAGASPLRALTVEGGRIGEIFSMGSGGVGGTLKGIGTVVAGLLTGWVGLAAGIAAAAGVAGYATYSFQKQQDQLARSLEGVGQRAGLTVEQLNKVAETGAVAGHISGSQGRDLAAQYAGAGFSGDLTQGLIGSTKRFARFEGTDVESAGGDLTRIFSQPSAGLAELDKSLGLSNDALKQNIRNLEAQGNIEAARRVLLEAANAALAQTTDRTWTLSKAFEAIKDGASDLVNSLGKTIAKGVAGPTPLEAIRKQIYDLEGSSKGRLESAQDFAGFVDVPYGTKPDDTAAKIAALRAQEQAMVKAQDDTAKQKKADSDANRLSGQAGDIIRQVLPDIVRAETLTNQITLLKAALSDPAMAGKLNTQQGGQALQNLQVLQANSDPLGRIKQDYEVAIQGIEAVSLAERAGAEARKAGLAVLRETGDVVRANMAAESARNQTIAKANEEAEESLEKAKRDNNLTGLRPFQRQIQEISNQFEDRKDKASSTKSEIDEEMKPWKDDLAKGASAVREHTSALVEGARAIRGLSGLGVGSINGGQSATGGIPTFAQGDLANIIKQSAMNHGIDPATALAVAKSEGLGQYVGDNGSSFGPFQLHYGGVAGGGNAVGGLGDVFTKRTGLDARDPSTVVQQIDFALSQASQNGWGAWHGAAKAGIGNWQGITNDNRIAPVASTAGASLDAEKQARINQATTDAQIGPLRAYNDALTAQEQTFKIQIETVGQSAATTAGLIEKLKLENQYKQQGIEITGEMADRIKDLSGRTADFAQRQAQIQQQTAGLDMIRGDTTDLISSPLKALASGKDPMKSLRQSLVGIGDKLIDQGAGGISSALFGKTGTPGGGLFGNSIGGLIGGGAKTLSTATTTITSGVVNVNGGVAGVPGAGAGVPGAGGGGSFWSSLFGGGGGAESLGAATYVPYARGGIHGPNGPVPLRRYAAGGVANSAQVAIFGEGSSNEAYVPLPDGRSIPVAMKSPKSAAGNMSSISSRGGDVIVHGNVSDNNMDQIKSYVDQKHAEQMNTLQRNFGAIQSANNKRFG